MPKKKKPYSAHRVTTVTTICFMIEFSSETAEENTQEMSLKFLVGTKEGESDCQTRILYQVEILFKNKSELKIFSDKN